MSAPDRAPAAGRIAIRDATPDDAEAMARVTVVSAREAYRDTLPDLARAFSAPEMPELWATRYRDWLAGGSMPGVFGLVADDPRQGVVGFLLAGPERTGDADYTGEVLLLYLLPTHQRRGLGRRLLAEGARRLVQRGHQSLLIWVFAANAAGRRFYEALGGVPARERENQILGVRLAEVGYGWRDAQALLGGDTTPGDSPTTR